MRECSHQIHCMQTNVSSGHLGQALRPRSSQPVPLPPPTHHPIITYNGVLLSNGMLLHIPILSASSMPILTAPAQAPAAHPASGCHSQALQSIFHA